MLEHGYLTELKSRTLTNVAKMFLQLHHLKSLDLGYRPTILLHIPCCLPIALTVSINVQKFSSLRKVATSGVEKMALSDGFSATQPRRVPARVAEVLGSSRLNFPVSKPLTIQRKIWQV